ncbi:DUF1801 domain-containing protein [Agromyces ramosus]|uniref:YdhG-like domain-containing protein n=1 Tax=Agromyces ramosus TaxID=33879 RepID=A0ABU0RCM5_9MICO|nr:DUF1801 domain-containing protein [Agromyces ramosus]MDQ0895798.1 hypothetical protein [Agromyces ramosus]
MAGKPNKTHATDASVDAFIAELPSETMRDDSRALIRLMQELTGEAPRMWGPTIIGFGSYHYRYASGREGDAPLAGFSPRKPELVIYLMSEVLAPELMATLGKHRRGKVCLYVKRLDDVDLGVLTTLIRRSIALAEETYPQA